MTVIINKQEELEALIDKNNNIIIADDLVIRCDIIIDANIEAWDIKAWDIDAWDIKANNNIDATNIYAINIYAINIKAVGDIKANNIEAWDIDAWDIKANNIKVRNINYYSVCIARESLICGTIEGERKNAVHLCLDQPIKYMTKSNNNKGNSQQGSKPAKTSTTYIKNDFDATVNFNKQGSITVKGISNPKNN